MDDCYICKELKEKGKYHYTKGNYTSICIEKGHNGKYRCFAWGEGEASISCNFCPHCGRQLEPGEFSYERTYILSDLIEWLKEQKEDRWFANDVARCTAYDAVLMKIHELVGEKHGN